MIPTLTVAGLLLCLTMAGCGPRDPVAAVRAQQERGDLAGSIEPLRELLAQRPDDGELYFLHGRALALTGQPSLGEWSLRKAMEYPEWRAPAGLQLAHDALRSRNYNTAIEVTGQLLEDDPDNLIALLMRANARAHSRLHDEEALADVERILELDPDHLDALEPKILALLGLGRIEEAAAAIDELGERIEQTEVGPELRGWHCATRAIFADESGETEEAEERWADCVERFPLHANVIANAVQFYDARGELERSREILRAVVEAYPRSRDHRLALVERLRRAGEMSEAEARMREGTEVDDPRLAATAWMDLSAHYQGTGDLAASAEAAEQALELARGLGAPNPQLLLAVADSLLLAGELDRARDLADELDVETYRELLLARLAQARGAQSEALAHYEKALRLWPDNPFARYYAARAAEAIGDFDRAVEAYRYAIRIDPAATDARVRLARLHAAEGKPTQALRILRTRSERVPLDLEGELLSIELWARVGDAPALRRALAIFGRGARQQLGRALARAAEGVRAREGAAEALRLLRAVEGVDLANPRDAEALRAVVRLAAEAGALEDVGAQVEAAVAAHPEVSVFHEIRGRWLEGLGREDEARAAWERALALDAARAPALAGLARLALPHDTERALALFDRALEVDPDEPETLHASARALRASGRLEEAERRYETLLAAHPHDAGAASALVEAQLARGPASERTLELAQRAVRFGGGADALDLLSRVHAARSEPELATDAAARARALRDRSAPANEAALGSG